MSADQAADVLRSGGIIAYPTEGVFGLGCLPDDLAAVTRLLQIKQREPSKGLILIGADAAQFADWMDPADDLALPAADPSNPVT